jgi:lysophospholipase L1-like esterase
MLRKKHFIILLFLLPAVLIVLLPFVYKNRTGKGILHSLNAVLMEDPVFIWRQKPGLNTVFQGVKVSTNDFGFRESEKTGRKKNGVLRICCMGASPTFGWGVEESRTYPAVLQQLLKLSHFSEKPEVINAGEIGFSSWQGLELLNKKILSYKPDVITVSYVLNDIDRYRFYGNDGKPDNETKLKSAAGSAWNNLISRNDIFVFYMDAARRFFEISPRLKAVMKKREYLLAHVRVSPADYKRNLEEFVSICRKNGISLVFIKMPVNLSLPELSEEERRIVNSGRSLNGYYYCRGCYCEEKGDYEKSADFFTRARKFIALDCQNDSDKYHRIMEKVALDSGVPLVDADGYFAGRNDKKDFFNKPLTIHPNAKGHDIIAGLIFGKLIEKGIMGKNQNRRKK